MRKIKYFDTDQMEGSAIYLLNEALVLEELPLSPIM